MSLRHEGGPGFAGAGGVGGGGLQALIEQKNKEMKKHSMSNLNNTAHAKIVNVNYVEIQKADTAQKVNYKFPKSLQKIIDAR